MNFEKNLKKYSFLKTASELADSMNCEIFIVGGFVRDIILNREHNEIDFLVIGDGPGFASAFGKKLGIEKISIFKNFGTAHFRYDDFDLEFVGARKESYRKNSRNPLVTTGTFDDDINRRDFTINTLAVSINTKDFGKLTDKFNGLDDIKGKIIKTPLNPLETFNDDPLRILRAFRFSSQLQFRCR